MLLAPLSTRVRSSDRSANSSQCSCGSVRTVHPHVSFFLRYLAKQIREACGRHTQPHGRRTPPRRDASCRVALRRIPHRVAPRRTAPSLRVTSQHLSWPEFVYVFLRAEMIDVVFVSGILKNINLLFETGVVMFCNGMEWNVNVT